MTVFGWDASDYDWGRGPMDLGAAARDGIAWFTYKATEGTRVRHTHTGEALRRARDAGIPVLGVYHVVRSPADAAAEVAYCLNYVNSQVPWWSSWPHWVWQIDLERWPYDSVPAGEGEQFADIIQARTGRLAVIYASRSQYGDQLRGTSHPLWNADYGSNPAVGYRAAYVARGGDAGRGWGPYSGITPTFWQYGSRTVIGRQPTCDASAYRGTLDQLKRLVAGGPPPAVDAGEEDDVQHMLIRASDDPTRVWYSSGDTRHLVDPRLLQPINADGVVAGSIGNLQVHQPGLLGNLGNGGKIFVTGPTADLDAWGVEVADRSTVDALTRQVAALTEAVRTLAEHAGIPADQVAAVTEAARAGAESGAQAAVVDQVPAIARATAAEHGGRLLRPTA